MNQGIVIMIVAGLMGGLGNQMFQYACAKAVARRLNKELRLDLTMLLNRKMHKDFTYRNYELSHFNISEKTVARMHQRLFVPDLFSATEKEQRKYGRIRKLLNFHLYREETKFTFEQRILNVRNNTYLYGYFQSGKYFEDIREDLLRDFELKEPLDEINQALLDKIQKTESVSLHVRRGDYLKSVNSQFQRLTSENYYREAVKSIMERTKESHFFVFSDEPESVTEEFSFIDAPVTFVSSNKGDDSYKDLILMRSCKHNIIANSSFSWWSGWLNNYKEKIVIAPGRWYSGQDIPSSSPDLIPKEWCVLPVN